jgi:hypothetical protein
MCEVTRNIIRIPFYDPPLGYKTKQMRDSRACGAHTKYIFLALALFVCTVLGPDLATIHLYEGSLCTRKQAPRASSEPYITPVI